MVQYITDRNITDIISELENTGKEVVVILASESAYTSIPNEKPKDENSIWRKADPVSSHTEDIDTTISNILRELGMPANLLGYTYTRAAIRMVCENMELIHNVTKALYPELAEIYNTTSSRAERAIRHAIEVVWTRGNITKMDELFGYTINSNAGKPTNSEFIAMIADHITLKTRQ